MPRRGDPCGRPFLLSHLRCSSSWADAAHLPIPRCHVVASSAARFFKGPILVNTGCSKSAHVTVRAREEGGVMTTLHTVFTDQGAHGLSRRFLMSPRPRGRGDELPLTRAPCCQQHYGRYKGRSLWSPLLALAPSVPEFLGKLCGFASTCTTRTGRPNGCPVLSVLLGDSGAGAGVQRAAPWPANRRNTGLRNAPVVPYVVMACGWHPTRGNCRSRRRFARP